MRRHVTLAPPVLCLIVMLAMPSLCAAARRVTYKAVGSPLSTVLSAVSSLSGESVTADAGAGELRVAVFARDLSPSDLRAALCSALRLECVKQGGGYVLTPLGWTSSRADDLRSLGIAGLRKHLDDLAQDLRGSNNPGVGDTQLGRAVRVCGPGALLATALYDSIPTDRIDAMIAGSAIEIGPNELPTGSRGAIMDYARKWFDSLGSRGAASVESVEAFTLSIADNPVTNTPSLQYGVTFTTGTGAAEEPVVTGYTAYLDPVLSTLAAARRGSSATSAKRSVTIDSGDTLYEALGKISSEFDVSIVCDYTSRLNRAALPASAAGSYDGPGEALAAIAGSARYDWKRADGAYVVSNMNWFRDRELELPLAIVQELRSSQKAHGGITFKDVLEIASLDSRQLATMRNCGLGDGYPIIGRRQVLLFVRSLTQAQIDAAMSASGLALSGLSPSQSRLLDLWATSRKSSIDREAAGLVFRLTSSGGASLSQDTSSVWVFAVESAGTLSEDEIEDAIAAGRTDIAVPQTRLVDTLNMRFVN